MKELYMSAEMEVVKFSIEDVITTSTDFVPTENMGEPDYDVWA